MNSSLKKIFGVILVGVSALAFSACAGPSPEVISMANSISVDYNCVCGSCDLTLPDCHCDYAINAKKVIEKRVSKGETNDQIRQFMIEQYGQRVVVN